MTIDIESAATQSQALTFGHVLKLAEPFCLVYRGTPYEGPVPERARLLVNDGVDKERLVAFACSKCRADFQVIVEVIDGRVFFVFTDPIDFCQP